MRSVGDVNGDGQDDFFVGGARGQSAHLYLQLASGFKLARTATTVSTFFEYAKGGRFNYTYGGDINGDGVNDFAVQRLTTCQIPTLGFRMERYTSG